MKLSGLVSLAGTLHTIAAAPSLDKHSQKFYFSKINKIVSFGDSWTDTRFNTSGAQPSASNPFGNTGKTSSNGKMWPMYLTAQYNQSSVSLYNMAVGGAVTDINIVKTGPNDVVTQVSRFEAYVQQQKPNFFSPKRTLYTVFIGINDIYRTINDADQDETVVKIMERLMDLTTELHGRGARQFLFISTPPQSLFPNNLDRKLPYSTFFLFDIVPLITDVTEDPTQFPETAVYKSTGFCADYKSGTITPDFKSDNCEYNALEYMYIDGAHPTQAFHQILAKKIAEQLAAGRTISRH
ncbi:hypothetical protein FGADI_12289 [Fusarium gaditjirri]|uniref:Acetylesterase n=1 Tax=Fusarium gaditjirri TaxID=282569 RepID=A0A8H4SSW7_9HYPO|nr:hypothetical protein FGADI_12289 [Fusarium gaditjirri]